MPSIRARRRPIITAIAGLMLTETYGMTGSVRVRAIREVMVKALEFP